MVTTPGGSPYLHSKGRVTVPMFVDYDDALEFLRELRQSAEGELGDATITALSFAKGYEMAQADGGPTGSKDKQGKDVLMYYVFSPSSKARRDANEHCRKARRALKKSAVGGHVMACFEAKGLSVARGGAEVWPLFMDFDDLMEAWEAEREARPDMPAKPEVEVVNAMDLVAFLDLPPPKEASSKYQEAHRAYQAMFKNYGLVPASRNMDMIKGIKAKGKSRARLHVRM